MSDQDQVLPAPEEKHVNDQPSNPDAAPDQEHTQVEVVAGPEAGAPAEGEGRVLVFDEDPEDQPTEAEVEAVEEVENAPLTELRVGSTGPEVSAWQEREGLHVTGEFTDRDAQYVKNRQTRQKLDGEDVEVNGVVKL